MARNTEDKERLHNDIRTEYNKLQSIIEFGVPKYTSAWIFRKLQQKYYLSPSYLEKLVYTKAMQN